MIIECGSLWDNMKTLLTKHIRDQGKMQTVRSGGSLCECEAI